MADGQLCMRCDSRNDPGALSCGECGAPLPPPVAAPPPAPLRARSLTNHFVRYLPGYLVGVVVCLGLLLRLLDSPPGQITRTVTLAQVQARPEAALRYPSGTQVATVALTGTTVLQAERKTSGYGRRSHSEITGYAASTVNGGTRSRLFATGDSPGRVLDWYRRALARAGWTAHRAGSDSGLTITLFARGAESWGASGSQPEEFALYTGDAQIVAYLGGGSSTPLPRARTVFATRYTLYPEGTMLIPLS